MKRISILLLLLVSFNSFASQSITVYQLPGSVLVPYKPPYLQLEAYLIRLFPINVTINDKALHLISKKDLDEAINLRGINQIKRIYKIHNQLVLE